MECNAPTRNEVVGKKGFFFWPEERQTVTVEDKKRNTSDETKKGKEAMTSSSAYPRPRRGGVGGKCSSSHPKSLRDIEAEVEDVFETHSVAEIREVKRVFDFLSGTRR